jgi:myo-inositol-1(or 4)-monophosphatase
MKPNFENIIKNSLPVIKEAGSFLKNEIYTVKSSDVETKNIHDFVTYVDRNSEMLLVNGLKKILPDAGFITEEQTIKENKNKELVWIIDPLDGTTNYIHKLPPYSISVALMYKGELCGGIIYEITHNELFYAWKNGGAYLNGNAIKVSSTAKVFNSLIATGFPFKDYSRIDGYMETLKHFMGNSLGLRRLGSAAVDLAYVACGRFDAFYEYSLKPWDVAAGAFIVSEAGGKICDFDGGDNFLYGEEIIATNNMIFDEFLNTVKSFLNGQAKSQD